MRKIKKLKRISIMLLCAVLLHGGCGSRTTEETEKVDTTENFDLIGTEGWEYQGEKKQYIYGEWTVTGVRKGDTWDETDERVGAVTGELFLQKQHGIVLTKIRRVLCIVDFSTRV